MLRDKFKQAVGQRKDIPNDNLYETKNEYLAINYTWWTLNQRKT